MSAPLRNSLLRQLHAAVRTAQVDEDDYRNRLEREFGCRSAKNLSDIQLAEAVSAFHVKYSSAQFPHHRKIKALWIAAWNLGALAVGDDRALDAFIERQTGKQRLAFVTPGEAASITEALKDICRRHGFEIPANDPGGMKARGALLYAQWHILATLGAVRIDDPGALDSYASRKYLPNHYSVCHLKRHQLDDCARHLGSWIRREIARKAAAV